MERRQFVAALGGVAVGLPLVASTSSAQQPGSSTKVKDVTNIGRLPDSTFFIETEKGGGWVRLGDSAQDARIWGCAAAIWAARRAGAQINATIYFTRYVTEDPNSWFEGVSHIHLTT
jgi:hypothetical protein